jgi:hypothetical protein
MYKTGEVGWRWKAGKRDITIVTQAVHQNNPLPTHSRENSGRLPFTKQQLPTKELFFDSAYQKHKLTNDQSPFTSYQNLLSLIKISRYKAKTF